MKKVLASIKPYLNFIDSGRFFEEPLKWLYGIFAVGQLLVPVFALIGAINSGVFNRDTALGMALILVLIIMLLVSCFCAAIWWSRKDELTSSKNEFIVMPIVAHLIKTAGEVLGTWIGFTGIAVSIIGALFSRSDALSYYTGVPTVGLVGVIASPIVGYLTVLFSRYIAETVKVLGAIANNTKKK